MNFLTKEQQCFLLLLVCFLTECSSHTQLQDTTLERLNYAQKLIDSRSYRRHEEEEMPEEGRTDIKVGIMGGGIAGLYSGLLLQSIGIDYEILEASEDHIGGRIWTHYFDKEEWDRCKPGDHCYYNYFDAGAMRFPKVPSSARVNGNEKFSLFRYLNERVEPDKKFNIVEYHLNDLDGNQYLYFNNRLVSQNDFKEGESLGFSQSEGGTIPDDYTEKGHAYWLDCAFDGFKDKLGKNFQNGFETLLRLDNLSTREFLRTFNETIKEEAREMIPYSNNVIDWLETMSTGTGWFDEAFVESLIREYDFRVKTASGEEIKWESVEGGTSRVIVAMNSLLENPVLSGHKIIRISINQDDSETYLEASFQNGKNSRKYDYMINTIPFNEASLIDFGGELSIQKRTALRLLAFEGSVKVGLQFKTRWWEDKDKMDGKSILGGNTKTDLPVRVIVYPSYGIKTKGKGVLIASYTWAQDAYRMSALSDEEAVQVSLDSLRLIHGPIVDEEYTGESYVHRWDKIKHIGGGWAAFRPAQFKVHFPSLIKQELNGRLHFAGEVASINHGWIIGSLNSAHRAVYEILKNEGLNDHINDLIEKWGELEEPVN